MAREHERSEDLRWNEDSETRRETKTYRGHGRNKQTKKEKKKKEKERNHLKESFKHCSRQSHYGSLGKA